MSATSRNRCASANYTATAAATATEDLKPPVKGLRMSSPCTGPKLVGCRVRGLAKCFYSCCRLPLEEEPGIDCSKSPQMSSGSIVSDSKGGGRGLRASEKMPIEKKRCKKHQGQSVDDRSSPYNVRISSGEPRLAEEDYMVFCFREDGAIHMINEGKSSSDENKTTTNLRSISKKSDEKGSNEMDKKPWPHGDDDEIKEGNPVEQPNPSKMDYFDDSCDSNLSDTSTTSSFAFPVLGVEWIGSPVHMPKSEKRVCESVRFDCCRF